MVTDARLSELVKQARLATMRGRSGTAVSPRSRRSTQIVRDRRIDADFAWVDGYLHAPLDGDRRSGGAPRRSGGGLRAGIRRGVRRARRRSSIGPACVSPARRGSTRANISPALASAVVDAGGRVYEHSEVGEFRDSPRSLSVNGQTVSCGDVVIATHNPLVGVASLAGATLFQTKLALYSTYVVAGRVARGRCRTRSSGTRPIPITTFASSRSATTTSSSSAARTTRPGRRPTPSGAIAGSSSGSRALVPGIELTHRWSGQVIETQDGLPYIGESADHQYAATGFSGNGMTFGTLAAMMATDAILGRRNPWARPVRSEAQGARVAACGTT